MEKREVKTVEIVLVTADRGLCGSFNANMVARAEKVIAELQKEGKKVSIVCVGKKGEQKLRKTGLVRKQFPDLLSNFEMFNAREIAQDLAENFLAGNSDEVRLIYSKFVSVANQQPHCVNILPISAEEVDSTEDAGAGVAYTYEPSPEQIMEVLQPLYLNVMVYHAMLEVSAGEHAARMTSMDNATKACADIIENLTKIYNKVRQGSITADLMDIVGGAEALK